MAKRLRVNPNLPMCPTHDHGNIYAYEDTHGEMIYRCVHQEHDPMWGSGEELLRPATRNSWNYDELFAAAQNKKGKQIARPQVIKEERMDMEQANETAQAATTPATASNGKLEEVIARAGAKGMSIKEFAVKADLNLGSLYNALRAEKAGRVIYSAKFMTKLEKALTD